MSPNEYQTLASRTECDQDKSLARMADLDKPSTTKNLTAIRLNHAVIGMAGEVGELAGAVERWIYYGKELDSVNIKEETGDLLWYAALACNAVGLKLEDVMTANIGKLKLRYPDKYTDELAAEENRDRAKEREAIVRRNEACDKVVAEVDKWPTHSFTSNEMLVPRVDGAPLDTCMPGDATIKPIYELTHSDRLNQREAAGVCSVTKDVDGRIFWCSLDLNHEGLHKSGCGEWTSTTDLLQQITHLEQISGVIKTANKVQIVDGKKLINNKLWECVTCGHLYRNELEKCPSCSKQ